MKKQCLLPLTTFFILMISTCFPKVNRMDTSETIHPNFASRSTRKIRLALSLFFLFAVTAGHAQYLSIGVQGGFNFSNFNSPKIDNLVTGQGLGYQLGFFVRFGQRVYYDLSFNWIRANDKVRLDLDSLGVIEDDVPLHNFDLTAKVGYQLVREENFRWRAGAGPFLGWPVLFSTNVFEFEKDDMVRPQWGFQFGSGIDFKKFNFDIDYNLHVSELFIGDEQDLGIDFGSRLHVLLFKFGVHL